MTVRLPTHHQPFPKAKATPPRGNAWGSQWKHLPKSPRVLVRNTMLNALRAVRQP